MTIAGMGVYRLEEDYMPVAAGDLTWMASYCPQCFVAMGKKPARYIYYKDIHRDGLHEKE
jgi:(S)-ureidoglycine aminohydrolase